MGLYKKEFLRSLEDIISKTQLEYLHHHDLSLFSAMRLKAVGDLFIVKSIDDLKALLTVFNEHKEEIKG